ncbi:MAG TPA: MgtC/SapB family protein, partial [Blastocatellia bacterium]|nr:MgtC/SapB family protein [Blastocatellia bacterium]
MEPSSIFQSLGIALGLGLLVGLQRERASKRLGGLRTFPLVTILGSICAMLAQQYGGWIVAVGFAALTGVIMIANYISPKEADSGHGVTTEIAMLLMYGVGACLIAGYREAAIVVGGGVAVLLQFKVQLHGIASRLGDDDLKAIMQFALISLVILPFLPNRTYGPYSVLNPRQVWWMVVLIVGISLGGYIIYKFFGSGAGILLGGVLGGTISSTATTVSFARRSKESEENSVPAAALIIISSAVVFIRVLLEIAVVSTALVKAAAGPLLIMFALLVLMSLRLWIRQRRDQVELPPQGNPSELKPALVFGLLYAGVLFAVAAAEQHFGNRGLYFVAGLSGLTDVDATTLSASQLVNAGRLDPDGAWR